MGMKITKVEPLMVDRFCFVRIETDKGLVGVGESGTWGQLEASATAIRKYAEYLVGKDPRYIEHHWNVMLRANHFTGGAINGAVSAIDIALWDIKGKHYGVPVYELLGGKMRDKARLYAHAKGRSRETLIEEAVRLKEEGFTALGHLNPLLDEDEKTPYYKSHAQKIEDAAETIRQIREAVGPSVDLCVEIHRRMTPPEAVALARAIEQYKPMFFEDPLRPNDPDAMAWVADHIHIPVATGERFFSIFQFQTLLNRRAVAYLRPDVCLCGGITGAKKIAAMAEANDCSIVPHNPLSIVSTAACLQIAACIPNFAIQEYPTRTPELEGSTALLGNGLATGLEDHEKGFIAIPEGPGIGLELVEDVEKKFPPRPRKIAMRPHFDGSVVDM
jgi:galactonate dehydratase